MATRRVLRAPVLLAALTLGGTVLAGCVRPTPAAAPAPATTAPTTPPPSTPVVPGTPLTIRGTALATPAQLAAWFSGRSPQPSGTYGATVPLQTLTQLYVAEGSAEGIRGDVAFIQSVLETGWFRFGGSVPKSYNNFAGLGATGGGVPAAFPDARTGVRAQIQHLRAYADPAATTCTVPPLHNPCVDPRFNLVLPKGRATTWNQMGNGNWATSTTYASRILSLYAEMLRYNGITVPY